MNASPPINALSNARLDELRQIADPLADEAIAEVYASDDFAQIRTLLTQLRSDDDPVPSSFPPALQRYFEESAIVLDDRESAVVRVGEEFFASHGPEIMLVLCCYALPWTYSDKDGVQVLHRTGYLEQRPNRRVAQTAQMIVDVMSPGGLSPNGAGVRAAQRVRLMHAAVRRQILGSTKPPWDPTKLGIPINQEDLIYTMLSFSATVLDGLRILGLEVPAKQAAAYFEAWRVVAQLIGVRPELIPATLAEGNALNHRIHRRVVGSSRAGREMTAALVGLIDDVLGPLLSPMAPGLIRFFVKDELAAILGLPRRPIADRAVQVFAWGSDLLDHVVERDTTRRLRFGGLSIDLIQHFIDQTITDAGQFELPESLHSAWKTSKR